MPVSKAATRKVGGCWTCTEATQTAGIKLLEVPAWNKVHSAAAISQWSCVG